jgi:hypothetical protein
MTGLEQSVKEAAVASLIRLGVYNENGELITTNNIIKYYYEINWC